MQAAIRKWLFCRVLRLFRGGWRAGRRLFLVDRQPASGLGRVIVGDSEFRDPVSQAAKADSEELRRLALHAAGLLERAENVLPLIVLDPALEIELGGKG